MVSMRTSRSESSRSLAAQSVPITAIAVAVAFALTLLPGPDRDDFLDGVALAIGVVIIGVATGWRRFPRTTLLVVPLGYIALIAVLRASEGGSGSGYGGLFLLPVLWLAILADIPLLLVGIAGTIAAELIPLVVVGAPEYPASGWRSSIIRTAIAVIAGLTIQRLLSEARVRATENEQLYEASERWSKRLESLNEVGNALATETDLERLLQLVATRLRELVHADVVAVLLPHGDHELRFAAVAGPPGATAVGTTIDRETTNAGIWVPLIVRDTPIGVIAAWNEQDSETAPFSADDLRLAETFASRAALAVDLSERVARDSLRRAVAAQEDERRRIARELHDGTGQSLTSVMLGLKRVEEGLVGEARAGVAELGGQVAAAMQDVRRLALELRPKALDDFGLVTALDRLTKTFSASSGITVDVETALAPERRLPSDVETALYRIVQEALNNTLKHANADRVSVLLTPKNGSVLLVIEDNGRGFDPTSPKVEGLGLQNMRERVMLLKGRFEIESGAGSGTTLVAEVPNS